MSEVDNLRAYFLPQMQFMLLFSRQGKLRLQKWYVPLSDKERKKISRDLVQTILARKPKMCSFLEWRDLKIVYKRYEILIFVITGCCDHPDTPQVANTNAVFVYLFGSLSTTVLKQ